MDIAVLIVLSVRKRAIGIRKLATGCAGDRLMKITLVISIESLERVCNSLNADYRGEERSNSKFENAGQI